MTELPAISQSLQRKAVQLALAPATTLGGESRLFA